MNPQLLGQYGDNYFNQNVAPVMAALQSKLTQNGQQYGSFGGAALGQAAAQGAQDKFGAGLGFAQQLFGNQLQGRTSYFNGGPRVASEQNQMDVNRGLVVARLQQQGAYAQNNYNMNSAGMQNNFNMNNSNAMNNYNMGNAGMRNNYGLNNYGNQMQQYNQQKENSFNKGYGALGIAKGPFGLASGGMGYLNSNPGATLGNTVGSAFGNVGRFLGFGGGGSGSSLGSAGGPLTMGPISINPYAGNTGAIGIQ